MGTSYDVRGELELGDALAAWLAIAVRWDGESITIGALIAKLAAGGLRINGHVVGALPVHVGRGRARWAWRRIASEVAPELRAVSRALWDAGAPLASRGIHGHRDELGLATEWDSARVCLDGAITDVAALVPLIHQLVDVDPEAVEPETTCTDDDAEIPF